MFTYVAILYWQYVWDILQCDLTFIASWLYFFFCMQDYYKVLEDCDEKVQLANQVYDLVRQQILNVFHLNEHTPQY